MTSPDSLVLPVPELVDVIPVDQADTIIAVARQELTDLSHEVDAAVLAADAVERHAAAQGADPALVGHAAEQLQAFIEHRRAATDAELKVLLDAASAQARARIDDARSEADRITADARRLAAGPPAPFAVPPPVAAAPPPSLSVPAPGATLDAEQPPAIFPGHVFLDDDMPQAVPDAPIAPATAVLTSAPGPSEPLWLESPLLGTRPVASPDPVAAPAAPAPAAEPAPTPAPEPEPVSPWGAPAATSLLASIDPLASLPAPPAPAAAVVTPAAPADVPEAASPVAPAAPVEAPLEAPAPAATPAEPAPAGAAAAAPAKARIGSVPVFALLQVVGLLVVLVVLLVFVS